MFFYFQKVTFESLQFSTTFKDKTLRAQFQVLSAEFCETLKRNTVRSYFWSVFFCIRTEYRKIRTRNSTVFGHFSRNEIIHQINLLYATRLSILPENIRKPFSGYTETAQKEKMLFMRKSMDREKQLLSTFHLEYLLGLSNNRKGSKHGILSDSLKHTMQIQEQIFKDTGLD